MSAASDEYRELKPADQIDGENSNGNYQATCGVENPSETPTSHLKVNRSLPTLPQQEQVDNASMLLAAYGYVLGDSLGKGSYAVVKVAFSKKLKRQVAIKIITKKKAPQDYLKKFLPREIAVMKQLNHPNVIGLNEAIETSSRIFLVMDMADGGDLLDYIKTNGAISENEARGFFRQLVVASEYLHSMDVVQIGRAHVWTPVTL